MVSGIPQIYSLTQAFRAEERRSRELAAEFVLLEIAKAGQQTIDELMDYMESLCRTLASQLATNCKSELNLIKDETMVATKKSYLEKLINPTQKYFR